MKRKPNQKSPSCRMKGETQDECASRKIPELVAEGMTQEEAVGAAFGICENACAKKKKKAPKMYSLKGFVTKQGDNRTFKVVASTDSVDREGEIMDQTGWELDNYMRNPVILWAHDIQALPIGKATKVEVKGNELIIEGIFAEAEANPMAENVFQLFKAGIQQAVSVGFIPLERDGETITKAELLELSFVPVPANPEALARAKEKGLDKILFVEPAKVEGETIINNPKSSKRYTARNFRKLLMKRKIGDRPEEAPVTPEPANGLEEEILQTEVELKEVVMEIIENAIPDIETAVEKQLEGEPVIDELMKEVEEVIEKSLDEVMEMVVEDVEAVVEGEKQEDEVVMESEEAVEAILKDVGAEIADDVAAVIESKAEEILAAVEEEKQADAEENLATVVKEIEELIEKEVAEVLEEKTVMIAEEAVNEVATGTPEEKQIETVCDPASDDFDAEECVRLGGEVKKAGHTDEEEEDPKKPKKKE